MTTDTVGGVWSFALELAEFLAARGTEIILAALGPAPSPEQRAEAGRIPGLHLLAEGYKLEWMDDAWSDVRESGRWLLQLEAEYDPEVVHLNSYGHGALPWRAPVVLTAHSCVLSWWQAVKGTSAPPEWDRYRAAVSRSLKAADILTAPSRAMAEMLTEHYGAGVPPAKVVYNGRDPRRYQRGSKQDLILTAGRLWDEAKNVEAVVQVAPKLTWPVYIAGEQRSPDGKAAAIETCNALGKLSSAEMADWYSCAAIYALPARYEPFGLTALEAALSGCALVLGDIPSLREVWGDSAIYVDPDDAVALENALTALIEDADLRRKYAARAMARARSYSIERTGNEYIEIYHHLSSARRIACAS
jgi:glycogen synthase